MDFPEFTLLSFHSYLILKNCTQTYLCLPLRSTGCKITHFKIVLSYFKIPQESEFQLLIFRTKVWYIIWFMKHIRKAWFKFEKGWRYEYKSWIICWFSNCLSSVGLVRPCHLPPFLAAMIPSCRGRLRRLFSVSPCLFVFTPWKWITRVSGIFFPPRPSPPLIAPAPATKVVIIVC